MTTSSKVPRFGEISPLERELMKARVAACVLDEPTPTQHIGHFEILHRLGAGTTGIVYEVRDTRTGAEVALKLLRAHSSRAVERFKAEFRSFTYVAHRNLVQLYELFCDTNEWYFTMELVKGSTFTRYVGEPMVADRATQLERVRATLGQTLCAIQAVHAAGRLHCDLKPANVLVNDRGRVVVLDFGLATVLSKTCPYEVALPRGTPAYMAPELHNNGVAPSVASDAYSIGVMLFEALTGKLPAIGRASDASRAQGGPNAPRASRLAKDVPADLDELCARLLDRDPRYRASIDDAMSHLRLPARKVHSARPTVETSSWTGRRTELAMLHSAFETTRFGKPLAVFVTGASGIGKSALLARFATELGVAASVLRTRCHERESLPYKAFEGLVDALPAHLAQTVPPRGLTANEAEVLLRVFPQLRSLVWLRELATTACSPLSQQELRRLAFSGLKTLLRVLAEQTPLVLMVDDLQWADLDSAQLLSELLSPPRAPSLLYIGAYRNSDEEPGEFLNHLQAQGDASRLNCETRQIELARLDFGATLAMARACLGPSNENDAVSAHIAREASGIPLFVAELAAYFVSEPSESDSPLSLSRLFEHRLSTLEQTERGALCLMAVAARPLHLDVLDQALSGHSCARRVVHVLSARALVQANARGQLVIYHDRLREHLTASMTPSEVTSAHRKLAQAYAHLGTGDPEWLIAHWQAADDTTKAHAYAVAAAELAVSKLAFHRGASLYRTALALDRSEGPSRVHLWAALGDVLVNAGRGAEAAEAYLQASLKAGREEGFSLRCRASQQFLRSGQTARGMQLLKELLRESGLRYPESTMSVITCWLSSQARLALRARLGVKGSDPLSDESTRRLQALGAVFRECAVVDPLRGQLFQSLFLEEARRADDMEASFIGFAWETYHRAFLGNCGRSPAMRARLTRLDDLATKLRTPYAAATAAFVHATVSLCGGEYVDAARESARAIKIFREKCLGTVWEETFCSLVHTASIENVGPLTELCAESPRRVRRAAECADQLADGLLCTSMATAFLAQDEPEKAKAFLRERVARSSGELDVGRLGIVLRTADVLVYAGDGPGALQTLEDAWPGYLKSGFDRTFMRIFVRMRRAHAALLSFSSRPSRDLHLLAHREAARIERTGRKDAYVVAHGIRAAIAYQRGNQREAYFRLRQAVTLAEPMGVTITTHCYLLQLGRVAFGREGLGLLTRAESVLRAQGIANPARFANIYVTGI